MVLCPLACSSLWPKWLKLQSPVPTTQANKRAGCGFHACRWMWANECMARRRLRLQVGLLSQGLKGPTLLGRRRQRNTMRNAIRVNSAPKCACKHALQTSADWCHGQPRMRAQSATRKLGAHTCCKARCKHRVWMVCRAPTTMRATATQEIVCRAPKSKCSQTKMAHRPSSASGSRSHTEVKANPRGFENPPGHHASKSERMPTRARSAPSAWSCRTSC